MPSLETRGEDADICKSVSRSCSWISSRKRIGFRWWQLRKHCLKTLLSCFSNMPVPLWVVAEYVSMHWTIEYTCDFIGLSAWEGLVFLWHVPGGTLQSDCCYLLKDDDEGWSCCQLMWLEPWLSNMCILCIWAIRRHMCLYICRQVSLYLCLSVCLSVCLSLCLSLYLCECVCVCVCVWLSSDRRASHGWSIVWMIQRLITPCQSLKPPPAQVPWL